ncbi:hypothetical protein CHUAL_002682 [Chamberlinius hualienensis]
MKKSLQLICEEESIVKLKDMLMDVSMKISDLIRLENCMVTEISDGCGTKLKELSKYQHQLLPLYGKGQSYKRYDVKQLLHLLVLNGFIKEEPKTNQAYVRMGRRAGDLLSGQDKVFIHMRS